MGIRWHCLTFRSQWWLHYASKTWGITNSHTINFVGTVDNCVGCVCISDKVHAILLAVQSSLRSKSQRQE